MDALPGALAALAASDQFVTWFAYPSEKPGKMDKIPCLWHSGAPIDAHNPANWTNAGSALATHKLADRGYGSGIGFVFTANDPFFFLDIDGALQPDGQWSPLAQELCARFAGCAVEVSHSGRGLHVFGRTGAYPHGTRNTPLHLELYTSGRFVALTGTHASGDSAFDATAAFCATAAQFFPPTAPRLTAGEWTTEPVPEWSGPDDDNELIRRALSAAAKSVAGAFGGKLTFADLWTGNVPDDSRSEGDMSLANNLAFWTGRNCARMERLMRASGSYREKWETSRPEGTYLTKTILAACAFNVANGGKVASEPARPVAAVSAEGGPEFLMADEQLTYFAGCTYILDHLKIYHLGRNKLMEREAFNVRYGGKVFVMDSRGEKTTDNPYTALTQSRVNRPAMVDDMCFRPSLAPGEIITQGDWTAINTYVPYHCVSTPGDASPFLNHLAKMLPDPGDLEVLLQYLAHLAQRPGVKVQWWPVIQGSKGNGKTLITRCLAYINGEAYTHFPNAAALARDGMKFNAWVLRKTFFAIEEVALAGKRDFLEELKPIVTNERVPVEPKGVDAMTGDNAGNGLITTNHRDGVPIDDDERRYAIFFCAQQRKAHLFRDGMMGDYFPNLYAWLDAGGYAYVAHYLKTYPLWAQFPTRAPETTSTRDAIQQSLGRAEQLVMDAIEEERQGFAGGWVSSTFLDRLLDAKRVNVPLNKRREMMQQLGYDWHPSLRDGRVVAPIAPDNGKPKLYLREGHIAFNITAPADVGNAYAKAQVSDPSAAAGRAFK